MIRGSRWGGHRVALASLAILPFLVFLGPALAGHFMAPGDDLTQNLPLRILAGADIRDLHLPLWNPFIWSGTPLLAGFNGGALYPATLFFSFLPAAVAWALGEALAYAVAGTGVYLLVRRLGTGPLPAWLAGLAFTWSGFMMAQLRHVGLVQGLCWSGWILLGLDHLSRPAPGPRRRREVLGWAALVGLAAGFTALAGDPRSVSDVAVAAGLFWLWALWRRPEGRVRLVAGSVGAGALAAMVAAGQYLPGLAAESSSQRAAVSINYFGAGSLRPSQLLLSAFPFLGGGFDSLGLSPYSGTYNLPEISGYLGTLALAGTLALLLGTVSSRRRKDRSGVGPWALLGLVGVILAFGQFTPLAHLLIHVPLYNGERLQSRNLGEVDLALAVLFGLWAERFLATGGSSRWPERVGGSVPFLTVAIATGLAWLWPNGMAGLLESPTHLLPAAWPFIGVALGISLAVAALLWRGPAAGRRTRTLLLVLLTVGDVGFFAANAATGWTGSSELSGLRSAMGPLAQDLSQGGRYAIYDPNLFYRGFIQIQAGQPPVPDLNVISDTASVQGYGSLVAGAYENATGTHDQGSFDPALITTSLGRRLDLQLVLLDPHEDLAALDSQLIGAGWSPRPDVSGLQVWKAPYRPAVAGVSGGGAVSCHVPRAVGGGTNCTLTTSGPAHLVRSEAYAPGWTALVRRDGGPARQIGVVNDDLLQAVDLPGPGRWQVDFRYRPKRAFAGLVLSLAGLGIGLLGLSGLLRPARRPRWRPSPG
jgi:hypothetical protein